MSAHESQKRLSISDAAVQGKTGKDWQQWFAILDSAGATKMGHSEIARYLRERHQVPPWWSQMVANTYEQTRGMREKHQMPQGYQISVSKTIGVPVATLFQYWSDDDTREGWLLDAPITICKLTPNQSIRATWSGHESTVDVNFYAKSDSKSQVVVQHNKLHDAAHADRMKSYWRQALERLRTSL